MSGPAPGAQEAAGGLPAPLLPMAEDVPFGMSAEYGDLVAALVNVQAVLYAPVRNRRFTVMRANGERYQFGYATLDLINDMIRAPLAENGLILVHVTRPTKAGPFLLTRLMLRGTHQSMQTVTPIHLQDKSPHSWASAVTYARRHAICAMLNIAAEEDDDGNAAQGNMVVEHAGPPNPAQLDEALRTRFRGLVTSANEARTPADVSAVLQAWQRDVAEYAAWAQMPEHDDEWELLLRLIPSAINRVHGPEMADAWRGAMKARTNADLTALRERWAAEWTAAAERMRVSNAAGFGLLRQGLRMQTARVERQEAARPQAAADTATGGSPPAEEAPGPSPAQPAPDGHALFDEDGEPVSEPCTVPATYAEGYVEQDAYAEHRDKLRTANAAGLAWCLTDPTGAALLEEHLGASILQAPAAEPAQTADAVSLRSQRELEAAAVLEPTPAAPAETLAVARPRAQTHVERPRSPTDAPRLAQANDDPKPSPHAVPGSEAPLPPTQTAPPPGPVPLARTARGTPDLGRYLVGVKRSLLAVQDADEADGWEAANRPTYDALPQSFRMQVLAAKASREQVLGIERGARA